MDLKTIFLEATKLRFNVQRINKEVSPATVTNEFKELSTT